MDGFGQILFKIILTVTFAATSEFTQHYKASLSNNFSLDFNIVLLKLLCLELKVRCARQMLRLIIIGQLKLNMITSRCRRWVQSMTSYTYRSMPRFKPGTAGFEK